MATVSRCRALTNPQKGYKTRNTKTDPQSGDGGAEGGSTWHTNIRREAAGVKSSVLPPNTHTPTD